MFLYNTYYYIHDYNIVSDLLYSDEFKRALKSYLNLDVDKDWIGRLYGVINPTIDINGHFSITNTIIELDDENTNNNEQVNNFKLWIFNQLGILAQALHCRNLYDYISMELVHVGPINADNYLIIFDIASRKDMGSSFKRFIKQALFYAMIGLIITLIVTII
jgi:hypothetical protein